MMNDQIKDIPMLNEPLLTEEGFLNEACMRELESAILNIEPTHIRLSDDEECKKKRWTHLRDITGNFVCTAIRNIDHDVDGTAFPPGLEAAVGWLHTLLRKHFDRHEMAEMSLCDIARMLHEFVHAEHIVLQWNDEKVLRWWLDLDALVHSTCIAIRTDRRDFDRFNAEFEEEYGEMKVEQ